MSKTIDRYGIKVSKKVARKVDKYIEKYGEFEAYNSFGGKTIKAGIRKMVLFYKQNPNAPV